MESSKFNELEKRIISREMTKRGKKGGKATLDKYGQNHFSEIGSRGGEATRNKRKKKPSK